MPLNIDCRLSVTFEFPAIYSKQDRKYSAFHRIFSPLTPAGIPRVQPTCLVRGSEYYPWKAYNISTLALGLDKLLPTQGYQFRLHRASVDTRRTTTQLMDHPLHPPPVTQAFAKLYHTLGICILQLFLRCPGKFLLIERLNINQSPKGRG